MKKVLALILAMAIMCCSFITVVAADEDIVSYGAIQKPTQEDIAAADGYLKYNGIDLEAMEESVETALRNRAQNANVELANFPHYTQQYDMNADNFYLSYYPYNPGMIW